MNDEHDVQSKGTCFIVMPSGKGKDEQDWFNGWYAEVILPVVQQSGYDAHLAAVQNMPNSITTEILTQLIEAPMVVVDIGGIAADAEVNPNVLYELGIRHAFGLPHVIMGWEGQRIPFDVNDQRILREGRTPSHFKVNRDRLGRFIEQAEKGNFYKPIEAVARMEQLTAVTGDLQPLVDAILELRRDVADMKRVASQQETDPHPNWIQNWLMQSGQPQGADSGLDSFQETMLKGKRALERSGRVRKDNE